MERARRQDTPLTVAMIDIHSFKQINDNYGHAEGDRCLHEVAEAIGGAVRQPDLCFRWGGDEFALILTDTNSADAAPLGARLKGEVYGHCTRPDKEPMEITFAVAELGEGMSSARAGGDGRHGPDLGEGRDQGSARGPRGALLARGDRLRVGRQRHAAVAAGPLGLVQSPVRAGDQLGA